MKVNDNTTDLYNFKKYVKINNVKYEQKIKVAKTLVGVVKIKIQYKYLAEEETP